MIIIDAFHTRVGKFDNEAFVETGQFSSYSFCILNYLFFYFIVTVNAPRFQGNTLSKDYFRFLQSDQEYLSSEQGFNIKLCLLAFFKSSFLFL